MRIFKDIRRFAVCGFVLLAVFLLAPAMSYGLTVTNTNDAGAGSFRDAVANTPAGGTVDFAVTGTIPLLSEIEIDKNLTIQGPGADMLTVSGGNTTRVFNLTGGSSIVINDIRIADGFIDDNDGSPWGAAVLLVAPSLNLELNDCVVENNTSAGSLGLGIISFLTQDLSVIVNRCSFTNNSTISPGGLVLGGVFGTGAQNTTLEVNNSTFTNNLAQNDEGLAFGGVAGLGASPLNYKFNNCTFDSNRAIATNRGVYGGVLGDGAGGNTIQFTNSTFYNNEAHCLGEDCTTAVGGAIGSGGASEISCNHCTFAKNKIFCPSGDCGLFGGDTLAESGGQNISISNSIVYADDPSDSCFGEIVSLGYNIDNGMTCVDGTVMGDKINTDPMLDPLGLQDNGGPTETIALLSNSLAIDMADPTCPVDSDQRGVVRPQFLACDIGAYEFVETTVITPIPTLSQWGLIAMAGVLGIVGFIALRRKTASD